MENELYDQTKIHSGNCVADVWFQAQTQLSETCQDAKDVDPCVEAGYRIRKIATTRCAILKVRIFDLMLCSD
jgi:hypothetical protein